MSVGKRFGAIIACVLLAVATAAGSPAPAGDVHVRFKMAEPQGAAWYVRLGGYIHNEPWYLPNAVWPEGADKDAARRVPAGEFTPWLNFSTFAGKRFHGRLSRSGGVAEFPNVTADFVAEPAAPGRRVVIEIATAPDPQAVAKRFEESYAGSLTSFLISPDPKRDAADLETAGQMTERRLGWARAASGGRRVSPTRLLIQTSFWSPQREELNVKEAEVLWLLGFNVVGNQMKEVQEKFGFGAGGATHEVDLGPAATRADVDAVMQRLASGQKQRLAAGMPFTLSDEVVCRPPIGDKPQALAHFRAWLAAQKVLPQTLGVRRIEDVVPIETPEDLRRRQREGDAAARRVFYYTSRFRQASFTERLRWHTEAFHRRLGEGPLVSTLVADHPYFSGTGLGMGMGDNPTWGGAPLAADWFDLARAGAVDLAGIEDWMGLQFMYGPGTTWEGFQLMGFQASIFRSGSRGAMPIMAWITPSDETNLRLKTASALCQGAKHFFYWTYGPTATSTENYWSDLRGAYGGVAAVARQLAAAEPIISPGRTRKTRLALLYSVSSDLWQPFGYVHMLERRATYLALVHRQYLVDMLTEEDVEAGRLADYDGLYAVDPCVKAAAAARIEDWVRGGGHLYGACAAGSRNEFGEPAPGLARVFGIRPDVRVEVQPGDYHVRGAMNALPYVDEVRAGPAGPAGRGDAGAVFGVVGAKVALVPDGATVVGRFKDGSPAVVENAFGKGRAEYVGACPGISYVKEARFVPAELKEKWPEGLRAFIARAAERRGVPRLVELSHPVVEAGVYDADAGTALVLANFTYEPIRGLRAKVRLPRECRAVRSVEKGPLEFAATKAAADGAGAAAGTHEVTVTLDLGLTDIVLFE